MTGPVRTREQQGGQRPGRPAYRYLPAGRNVGGRTVLIAEHGYLRVNLEVSLRTLVSQSGHARKQSDERS